MADIKGLSETIQRITNEKKVNSKAKTTLKTFLNSTFKNEKITYSPNQNENTFSQIDFSMFLTGTILKVKFNDGVDDKSSLLVVEREGASNFIFVAKRDGTIEIPEDIPNDSKYKLVLKGTFDSINVSDVANSFLRTPDQIEKGLNLLTLSVDVMDGGLEPKKGKPVPKFGEATLQPVQQESPNK